MVVKNKDFVEIDYTGKLADGTVFDTTEEKIAKGNGLFSPQAKYKPATICVGERQILPGLDDELVGKEIDKEYNITLPPEKAFGKRDIKNLKIVPMPTFKQHQIDPRPGLQVDIDGKIGIITRVSGGRVMVNFNHPLAGKEVKYTFKINRKIENDTEKVASFLSSLLKIPEDKITVEVKENKAVVKIPAELPVQITNIFMQKLLELTTLKEVLFESSLQEKTEEKKA
ncbi:MAG: peptidylprolyl isomerase [Nanoarchaeota archaeon]|nr:peptidylprolyl isomerase [Nanoarchaeota archaeon]MBU1643613.1 peptidylprolyl isomerase [Nanoarchaeota archaeon]MBU1976327.1 peptidylprolyl isomerase [Nanoarchaeota archaeon]